MMLQQYTAIILLAHLQIRVRIRAPAPINIEGNMVHARQTVLYIFVQPFRACFKYIALISMGIWNLFLALPKLLTLAMGQSAHARGWDGHASG